MMSLLRLKSNPSFSSKMSLLKLPKNLQVENYSIELQECVAYNDRLVVIRIKGRSKFVCWVIDMM